MSQSDYTAYFRELADYYNNSRIPSNVMTGAAEIRAESEREGSWVRQCVESLHLTLAKKKVIEIGCGGGRWTQFIAQVAAQVVATDPCPRLLECARLMNLPNTEFVEADFLSLEKIEMTFNGACHVNIINHVPLQLLPTFLDKIHEKLEPGSMVFCASQRFRGNRDNLGMKDGTLATWSLCGTTMMADQLRWSIHCLRRICSEAYLSNERDA
jgi:2-polyprenyl-3-methyl-5-hydroxy-6-metoxy-1,4-benzoquinol methylase